MRRWKTTGTLALIHPCYYEGLPVQAQAILGLNDEEKIRARDSLAFVVCICNEGYEASLELHKIYREVSDEHVRADGDIRIVDESGEDYIYPAACFTPIEPPSAVLESLLRAS